MHRGGASGLLLLLCLPEALQNRMGGGRVEKLPCFVLLFSFFSSSYVS